MEEKLVSKVPENDKIYQETIFFSDNRLLIDLCGELDINLVNIENRLGVEIFRRGNQLTIIGEKDSITKTQEVLKALYQKLEIGKPVDTASVMSTISVLEGSSLKRSEKEISTRNINNKDFEIKTRKKTVEVRTVAQKSYVKSLLKHQLIFAIGPAGTGKTYLAVAVAVSKFINGEVDRIIFSRPAVEAGEKLGFLPGDMKEKVDPYMQPLYDAINDFIPSKHLQRYIEEKRIEIAPIAFMRGRTLSSSFIVLDEAQNATSVQMKMFLTRLGEGSRMVVTGDISQIDLPRGVASGLPEAQRLLKTVPEIGFNYFTSSDVVRNPLVSKIIEAYQEN